MMEQSPVTQQTEAQRQAEVKYARANFLSTGTCQGCGGTFAIGYAILGWSNCFCKACRERGGKGI